MKTTTVLLCVTFFSIANSLTNEQKQEMYEECVSETGVSEEIIEKALGGEVANDQKFRLFLLCSAKKVGAINDAGEIEKDPVRALLSSLISDEAIVKDLMAKCFMQGSTLEESFFEMFKCVYERK
uniref:Odorant-binding protein n=1 Tax=Anoplophora chinensis TaxID=217632 RepID=A0A2H4ZB42_ANOCN|nr:odorant-binding protein [Anoplophora chinensis]